MGAREWKLSKRLHVGNQMFANKKNLGSQQAEVLKSTCKHRIGLKQKH